MIWGLTIKPGQECTHEGLDEIHLSLASLECRPAKCQDISPPVSHLLLKTGNTERVLCTLEKGHLTQQSLDLVLQPKERVTFSVEGSGIVYVTGYSSSLPDDESKTEEEETSGKIQDEELQSVHILVKQEPEDYIPWEETFDEGDDGQIEDADIQKEQEAALIKEELGEDTSEGEFLCSEEQQDETPEVTISGSDTERDGIIASHSQNTEQTTQGAEDASAGQMEMTETQQNDDNTEHDETSGSMLASHTGDTVQATRESGDDNEGQMEVTETQQNENNEESDVTSAVASTEAEDIRAETSNPETAEVIRQIRKRPPRIINRRVVRSRKGSVASHTRKTAETTQGGEGGSDDHTKMTETKQDDDNAENDKTSNSIIASHTRDIEQTTQGGEDAGEGHMEMTEMQQNDDNAENGETSGTEAEGIPEASTSRMAKGAMQTRKRHPRLVNRRILPSRRASCRVREDQEKSVKEWSNPENARKDQFSGSGRYARSKVKSDVPPRRGQSSSEGAGLVKNNDNNIHRKGRKKRLTADDFFCRTCGKSFSRKYDRVRHEKLHTRSQKYKCRFCDQKFAMFSDKRAHESIHSDDIQFHENKLNGTSEISGEDNLQTGHGVFKCIVCPEVFMTRGSYNRHKKIHPDNVTFQCHVCDRVMSSKYRLWCHMNIHLGKKPFKCKYCKRTFRCKNNARLHQLKHEKDKSFNCNDCGRIFDCEKEFRDHQNIHKGHTPYMCRLCDKAFAVERNMRRHIRLIHMVSP